MRHMLQALLLVFDGLCTVFVAVFRSAVDSWAIQQIFPIMPIHRLCEEPTIHATLADLTCDSDGKVDRFTNPKVRQARSWCGCVLVMAMWE